MYEALYDENMGKNQRAVLDSIEALISVNEPIEFKIDSKDDLSLCIGLPDEVEQSIMDGTYTKEIYMEKYASKEQLEKHFESLGK